MSARFSENVFIVEINNT